MVTAALVAAAAVAQTPSEEALAAYQDAYRPDFVRSDLVLMVEMLRLDAEQRPVVEMIYEDYEAAFSSGVQGVRARIATLRVARPASAPGRTAAMRELQRATNALREEARRASAATDDPDERRAILEDYQRRVRELQARVRERRTTGDGAAAVEASLADVTRQAVTLLRGWEVEKRRIRDAFVNDVLTILHDPQREHWPALERVLRREKTLDRGRLAGESVDIVAVVRGLDLAPAIEQLLEPALVEYARVLDGALVERNAFLVESRDLLDAESGLDPNTRGTVAARQVELHEAVRAVNDRFTRTIADQLPPDDAAAFRAAVDRAVHPRLSRRTAVSRLLAAAGRLAGLDAAEQDAVRDVALAYAREMATYDDRVRDAVREHEPAVLRRTLLGASTTTDDPIAAAMADRRAAEAPFATRLRSILGTERFERLPGAAAVDSDAGRRSAGPARPAWVMEQFDEDRDGTLSPAELERLRAFLRDRAAGADDGE
jgi:hypothetical protein